MAITHQTALRNTLADAAVDSLDAGSSAASGSLEFRTSGDVEVATLTLSNPAAGSASSGSSTFNAITSDTSATGGTVAKFALKDRDGTAKIFGAVGTSGSDINLSSLSVGVGDTVSVASLVYTACP
jgi:hypothetical protein